MEMILNTSVKIFNFSFYLRGGLVTIQVPPGAVRVKEEHLEELRKIDMFNHLEKDHVLAVGVKGSEETPVARELPNKVKVPGAPVEEKEEPKEEIKEAKVSTKMAKGTKGKESKKVKSTLDLEDL